MGFIDSIGRTVAGSSQASRKKAGNTEEEKINAEIQKHQMNVLEEYQRIGEQYFKLFKDDPAPELKQNIESVNAINAQIKECEGQRRALKGLVLCERCGAEQPREAAFCSRCGNRLIPEDAALCPNCGSVIQEGALFCTNCGTKLQDDEQGTEQDRG